ncbi:MAG: FAD-dependent oxidoreductase [Rhodocyclaceae bacterium]|jgi:NADPH-dependent 2,4-dienoyl-CoA reductase/sulfur reductase-like enzyme|nr:FAD-dependent oxidoreductase [Rhodocyclaceae bacterium]
MPTSRRQFLTTSAALGACAFARSISPALAAPPRLLPASQGRRVVVVGGGWGGLATARHLRAQAPELEVVLLEQAPAFWSNPLSNQWLAGLVEENLLIHDYQAAARAFGYTFIQARVEAVERDRRQLATNHGPVDYDWLVLAAGIRHDYAAWFGADRGAAEHARQAYPCAFTTRDESAALKAKLARFAGGELVMTLPPMPYRCPPTPFERASLIGGWIKAGRIKGHLTVLDPNPGGLSFRKLFADQYPEQISYVSDARIRAVDPYARKITTDFDEYRFDHAILMPPQQAGDLLWQADLIGRDRDGAATGWAEVEPLSLQARGDSRVFVVGDALGNVSPLFGAYPKSGHMACRQGRIVAHQIAARARGEEPPRMLPESVCFVLRNFAPQELVRIEARYRLRGDGLIQQTISQTTDPNPQGEDRQWAGALFQEILGHAPPAPPGPT